MSTTRCYVDGRVTPKYLAAKRDQGLVLTDLVPRGYLGGDVAYFREGTPDEIRECRERMANAKAKAGAGE